MKKFRVTVNGNTYEVDVEEIQAGQNVNISSPSTVTTSATQTVATTNESNSSQGNDKVEAPMQGKILSINVTRGQSVNEGDVIAVLEAMKMENEIFAPKAGTVASINVTVGQSVNTGDLIVSLN